MEAAQVAAAVRARWYRLGVNPSLAAREASELARHLALGQLVSIRAYCLGRRPRHEYPDRNTVRHLRDDLLPSRARPAEDRRRSPAAPRPHRSTRQRLPRLP